MDMRVATRIIRTLWSRLRGAPSPIEQDFGERRERSTLKRTAATGGAHPVALQDDRRGREEHGGVLLPFPLRGEALLVKLADQLQSRIGSVGLDHDPLLLRISRCPGSRLSIDRAAHVEFLADRNMYCVSIEAQPETKVTVETTDFDTVVQFVVQYVAERLAEPVTLDVAS
ncbi:hypothetical protein [Bradyrhizobium roseum]|uniref:hypothetical protein n=1 Tax=Bradyrhizobium roseum TaxID=3056648 RepID=UPI002619F5DC|nr:hypothetical protein [Bradyrhizobium roseus]WKA26126.1 hypothetical protein QUH67_21185 [Bradyrhizobium roseus]